nr:caspase family protein [uncultured Hyphomonas sp.]
MRFLTLLMLGLISGLSLPLIAFAEPKVALVIGNSKYQTPGWQLENPENDARLIAASLDGLGFDVEILENATLEQMNDAFGRMRERLTEAGPDATGFFYFAGHGIQSQGLNYLIPVDAEAYNEADVWRQAPNLGLLMRDLDAAKNATNFIVLDACRNNPLPSAVRSAGGGLAPSSRVRGTLIAYATAPGTVAEDGQQGNSPFSLALSQYLPQPGLPAEGLFRRVATRVEKMTSQRQQPWIESGLRGEQDYCFAGCKQPAEAAVEGQALLAAFQTEEVPLLQAFLDTFPQSRSRSLVEVRIDQLTANKPAPDAERPAQKLIAQAPYSGMLTGALARSEKVQSAFKGPAETGPPVFFDQDSSEISSQSMARLQAYVANTALPHRMARGPGSIRIIAGCDLVERSVELCSGRADALEEALVSAGLSRNSFGSAVLLDRYTALEPEGVDFNALKHINRFAIPVLVR